MKLILNSNVSIALRPENSQRRGGDVLKMQVPDLNEKGRKQTTANLKKIFSQHPNFAGSDRDKEDKITTYYYANTKLVNFVLWLVSKGIGVEQIT